ncbi:protein MAIN-LIKE 1-like [Asparagus officinalis]|uniref:protein MAIN-LIKE 1-like n=1 Tax=Asparagus officinalis TaxID=4686 RepID=UPI00098DF64A|nr:protein MAIN-LIKE 1-like [Asparagus officinalis]
MDEATITLQDVSVILGLRIDGPCISGTDSDVWPTRCEQLLGVAPESIPRGNIKLKWLRETFSVSLPVDASQILVDQHARAYIIHIIGTILFPDSSKDKVHARWLPLLEDLDTCGTKSWGSAVLAYLYREILKVALMQNRELKGCLSLLQVWASSWLIVHQAFIHRWNDRHFCIVNQIEPTPRESDY